MTTLNWTQEKKHVYRSEDRRFVVEVTSGRRGTTDQVWFADDTRGTTAKRFFSLYVVGDGVRQHGNYRTLAAAFAAADTLAN